MPECTTPKNQQHTAKEMALCGRCLRFNIQSFRVGDNNVVRGYNLASTLTAASEGCEFCSLLLKCLRNIENIEDVAASSGLGPARDRWIHLEMVTAQHGEEVIHPPQRLNPWSLNRLAAFISTRLLSIPRLPGEHLGTPTTTWRKTAELYVAAEEGSAAAVSGDIAGRYLGGDYRSQQRVGAILEWISKCLDHPRCSRTASGCRQIDARNAPLPTRCIELLGETEWTLAETGDKQGTYLILSHRWGTDTATCVTTTGNYAERTTKRMPISNQSLPEAFRDVLWLARQLGVRYVWIDSLCIVQSGDKGQDWKHEALRMASYFQHALVTLATTIVEERPVSPPGMPTIKSSLIPSPLKPAHNTLRPRHIARLPYRNIAGILDGHFYVYENEQDLDRDYLAEVSSSPLLRRGWVFQEWILSKRIVCFTRRGTFMLCQSHNPRNECGHYINPRFADEWATGLFLKGQFSFVGIKTVRDLYQNWRRLVTMYSALFLTKPEADHIIALAGIANEFREALGAVVQLPDNRAAAESATPEDAKLNHIPQPQILPTAYLAGNWLGDIYSSLLWISEITASDTTRSRGPHRIGGYPTWSWASHDGPVGWIKQFEWRKMRLDCHLEGLKCSDGSDWPIPDPEDLSQDTQTQHSGPSLDDAFRSQWDVSNTFAGLAIRARTQPVLIGPLFYQLPVGEDTMLTAYVATDNPLAVPLSSASRAVMPCSLPNIVHGWAKLDPGFAAILGLSEPSVSQESHPTAGAGSDNGRASGAAVASTDKGMYHAAGVLALHVSTRLGIRGGYSVNGIPRVHEVFDVLFVTEIRDASRLGGGRDEDVGEAGEGIKRYHRIGIGRLYGVDMEMGFNSAMEEILELL